MQNSRKTSAFPVQDQAAGTEITAEQKEQEKACLSVLGATVAGNTVLLQGDGLKDRNALFCSYGTA